MHFASLIQRICKLIRPHLTAKENTRVGLLDSRSWWSHAPAAPGLTWTCHYPEERAANHSGPVRCIAVGLERRKAGEWKKKACRHVTKHNSKDLKSMCTCVARQSENDRDVKQMTEVKYLSKKINNQ